MEWVNIQNQLPPVNVEVEVFLTEESRIDLDELYQCSPSDGSGYQFRKYYLWNVSKWRYAGTPLTPA